MSADAIKVELEKIRSANLGLLRPADVVKFAKNPKTALHSKFTWDDGEAAYQYRLWQARQVIRYVVNVVGPESEVVRVYASIQEDRNDDGGYRTLASIMSDEDMRLRLLAQAKADMVVFRDKYRQLVELVPVFEAMNPLLDSMRKIR